jgi:hypothetical protein
MYSMPAHFGGREGQPKAYRYDDVTSITISYETERDALEEYLPEGFELKQPILLIDYEMNCGVDWMAGGSYNLICVQVPVVYTLIPEPLEGWYALVVWENKTCPILPGREATGIPKIFADIQDHHQLGDRCFTNASYEGLTFLRMDVRKTQVMMPEKVAEKNRLNGKINWFGWRYIPNIGKSGAALSHATLFPQESIITAGWHGEGQVQWEALTQEQHPTQAHIIDALRRLPIKSYIQSEIVLKISIGRPDLARSLP